MKVISTTHLKTTHLPPGDNELQGYIYGLVQDCSDSIANALELLQSCSKPWIFSGFLSLRNEPQALSNYIPRIRRIGRCYGFTSKPPAARNGVNAITQKPRDELFSNLVYTLVVIVSWPD